MMIINESNSNSNSNSHSHSNSNTNSNTNSNSKSNTNSNSNSNRSRNRNRNSKSKSNSNSNNNAHIYIHTDICTYIYTHIYICIIDHLQSDKRILSSSRPAQQSSHGRLADPGGLGPWHLRKPASRPAARPMPIDGNRKLCDADLNHRPSVAKRGQAGHLGFRFFRASHKGFTGAHDKGWCRQWHEFGCIDFALWVETWDVEIKRKNLFKVSIWIKKIELCLYRQTTSKDQRIRVILKKLVSKLNPPVEYWHQRM